MANGAIKGITIVLGADASELVNSLNKADQSLKDTQKQLNDVNKALKFNPNNVDLLKQKATLLEQKIKDNTQSIKDMKTALKQMDDQGIDKTSKEYMDLERAIIEAESKQKTFNKQLREVKALSTPIAQLGTKFKEVGGKIEAVGQSMRGVSIAAAAVAASLGAIAYKSAQTADDLNTLSSQYGIATKDLQLYAAASELVDVSVNDIAKANVKLKKSMLTAQQGSKNTLEVFDKLGVSIEDNNGHLRNQDEIFQEVIQKLGQMKNETERDAYAMTIFGRSAANLNPMIEDMGETYKNVADTFKKNNIEIIDQETLDQANRFNDAVDIIKATVQQAVLVVGSKLSGYLAPAMEKVANLIGEIAGKIANMNPTILTIIGSIAGVVALLSPLLIGIGKVSIGIGALMQYLPKISAAMAAVPFGLVTAGFATLALVIGTCIEANQSLTKTEDELLESYKANAQARKEAVNTSTAQVAVAGQYLQQIKELNEKEKLSNSEKEKMKQLVEGLNTAMGEEVAKVNATNGKLQESVNVIKQRIEALKQQAIAEAYESNFAQAIKDQIELEKQRYDVKNKIDALEEKRANRSITFKENEELKQLNKKYDELGTAMKKAGNEADAWAKKMTEAGTKAGKSSKEASDKVKKNATEMSKAGKDAGEGYNKNLNKGMSKAKSTAQKGAKQAVAGANTQKKPMKDSGLGIGGNLISGMWDGIKNKMAWLKSKIASLFGSLKSWAKSIFGGGDSSGGGSDRLNASNLFGASNDTSFKSRGFTKGMVVSSNTMAALKKAMPDSQKISAMKNGSGVNNTTYSFGNITLSVDKLKDAVTIEQIADTLIRAKKFAPAR